MELLRPVAATANDPQAAIASALRLATPAKVKHAVVDELHDRNRSCRGRRGHAHLHRHSR
jgi:hypothetical protein